MAKRIAFAVLVIFIWPGTVSAQESIQGAQALYASASYDDALAMLDRLQKQPLAQPDVRDVQQNRALCLLALGRNDEAALAVAAVVTSDAAYRPSDAGTPPRVRALFKDVRSRMLPGIIVARYGEARAGYDGQQWAESAKAFELIVALASDPDLSASDAKAVQDYKVLADGFAKLALANAQPPAPPVAAPVPVGPAGSDSPAAANSADPASQAGAVPADRTSAPVVPEAPAASAIAAGPSGAERIFSSADTSVMAPTVIRQDIPRWSLSQRPPSRDGVLELTIGIDGRIERATLTQAMAPAYDHDLLEATRNWRTSRRGRTATPCATGRPSASPFNRS